MEKCGGTRLLSQVQAWAASALGAGDRAGDRAQPRGDCKAFFTACVTTRAFHNQLQSNGQKSRKKKERKEKKIASDFFPLPLNARPCASPVLLAATSQGLPLAKPGPQDEAVG